MRTNQVFRGALGVFLLAVSAMAQVPHEYLGALQWRLIGPYRGGRVVATAGVPGDPKTAYFGSVGGGVWKTTNAGLTWTPIFDSQPIASIGAIAVAPSDPDVIYVGTGESDIRSALSSGDGVYKSEDAGRTWKHIGLRDTRQISKIVVDPQNAHVVYVAALGHAYGPNDERGVFKSSDGGATWKRVLDKGPDIGASDVAMAEENSQILFATLWKTKRPPWSAYAPLGGPGSGLYRSVDAGATWTELKGDGLPGGEWGRAGVAVAPDGRRVYAVIDVKPGGGLYRSDDAGDTWKLMNDDKRLTSRGWYFDFVTVDPSNPDVVYVPNVAVIRSEDGGKTITIVKGEPGGDDYHILWVDPKNPAHLVLGSDQGTNISLDRGETWSSWYNQPTAQMYRVTTDNSFPYWVMGSQQDSGSIAVASRSDHGVISAQDMPPIGGGESATLAVDPNDSNIIYATAQYGPVIRYDRRTSLSQDVSPWQMPTWNTEIVSRKYRAPWTPPLVFSPVDKKTLYMGTQFVMKTTDQGLHWQQISPDLTGAQPKLAAGELPKPTVENSRALGYGVVFTIAPSPLNANVIWAGSDTGLIHLTTDGGKTWKDVTPPGLSAWSKISTIEASHFEPGEAFAAVDRHRLDDQRPYLYRTRNFGKTWRAVINGIGESSFLRVVREDIRRRNLLFAGTELGMYVSFDDGEYWQPLQLNLPVSSVQDISIHEDDLVIGTHGRSMWIMDDIAPLRELDEKAIAATSWLFHPAASYRVDNDLFLGTPLPPEEPQSKNPPDGAMIDYYLKSDASDVTMEISDTAGHLVRRFSSEDRPAKRMTLPIAEQWFPVPIKLEKTAGMHRFVWDLRSNSSGASDAEESTDESTPPRGPRVPPGAYSVRLTVKGASLTQSLQVKMDPRSHATTQELTKQFQLGQEMFAQAWHGRQGLAEVKSVQADLSKIEAQAMAKAELLPKVKSVEAAVQKVVKGDSQKLGLEAASGGIAAALKVVEGGDREVPAQTLELFRQCNEALQARLAEWQGLKNGELLGLNQELTKVGLAPVKISEIEEEVEYLMTR